MTEATRGNPEKGKLKERGGKRKKDAHIHEGELMYTYTKVVPPSE
jgi:hypothetical protein